MKLYMLILGIETSCDETAAAVVEDGTKILSNVVASSSDMHIKTGGIIPEIAARQQVRSIIPVIEEALKKGCGWELRSGLRTSIKDEEITQLIPNSKLTTHNPHPPIDSIAVTVGPGLIGSLLVGVETAKTLSYLWKKPIIPVNHLVAHIYANWIDTSGRWTVDSGQKKKRQITEHRTLNTEHITPQFPALALVVSGGHTDLVLMEDHPSASSGQANIKWIGGTRDDAAGEAFDKTARLLGLPYPGGPAISKEAEIFLTTDNEPLTLFPRPLIGEKNYDWSFSGLKTAVLREVQYNPTSLKLRRAELAAQVQEAIVDSLVEKSIRALKQFKPRSFFLAGGVAANKRLREKFKSRIKDEILQVYFHVPQINLCTDNAAYIAAYAFYNYKPTDWRKIKADPGLTIVGEV